MLELPMTVHLRAFACALVICLLGAIPAANAGPKRAIKKLAVRHFSVESRDARVIATASSPDKKRAALVRLQNNDVPVCHLLLISGKRKLKLDKAIRLSVCAAYDKDARAAKLKRVPLTTHRDAWRVFVLSKRVDAMAKGLETRRFWGLYTNAGSLSSTVFERTSTSFKSKANRAVNQAEICDAPVFSVADAPTTLTMNCKTEAMLGGYIKRNTATFKYGWMGGRFILK